MSRPLLELVDEFPHRSVLVIGEAMLDTYLHGVCDRLCPEGPVPIVAVARREVAPGGAANTALNVRTLGGRVTFLSVVGDDAEGAEVRAALISRGIDTQSLLVDPGRRTLAKHRVCAGGQLLLRLDEGSAAPLAGISEERLLDRLRALLAGHDAVIVSDYGYGILTPRVIAQLGDESSRRPLLVVDAKDLGAYRSVVPTAVKPNFVQAVKLLGGAEQAGRDARLAYVGNHGSRLLELTGARIAAVTLDAEGAVIFERGRPPHRTYARPADRARTAGAGDTFTSALALALAAGADATTAAELASAASTIVVGKAGTAECAAADLRASLTAGSKVASNLLALVARLEIERSAGRRLVLTSGCFDILHRGHIACLNATKALGDVLVVGLNSDASIRRLKGPDRPINKLDDRAEVLAALSCVDHIVAFDEETPSELVRAVRPHVLAKGGDYTRDMLPEAPLVEALGGVVHILPYVEERSTTALIARIRDVPRAA